MLPLPFSLSLITAFTYANRAEEGNDNGLTPLCVWEEKEAAALAEAVRRRQRHPQRRDRDDDDERGTPRPKGLSCPFHFN